MAKIEEKLVDKRIVDRNIRKGLLTKRDYETHVETLPDRAGQSEVLDLGSASDDDGSEE
jgi:hypothetical protein